MHRSTHRAAAPRHGLQFAAARLAGRVALAFVALASPAIAQVPGGAIARGPDTRPTIAVLYFNNSSLINNAQYDPLRRGIADIFITELSRNPAVRVVERDHVQKLLDEQNLSNSGRVDEATALRIGRVLAAHYVVLGGFVIDPRGKQMRLDARAERTETSEVEFGETVSGKPDDLLDIIGKLAVKMSSGMKLPDIVLRPPTLPTTPPDARGAVDTSRAATSTATTGSTTTTVTVATTRSTTAASTTSSTQAPRPQARPGDFQALMLFSRALAEEDRGNVEQAVALYKATLTRMPNYEPAQKRMARLQRPT